MLKIKRTNIALTRGDSAYITLNVEGIEPTESDVVRCQVRKTPNGGELLISAVATRTEDGVDIRNGIEHRKRNRPRHGYCDFRHGRETDIIKLTDEQLAIATDKGWKVA